MANVRKDRSANTEIYLALDVGQKATFPLGMYNAIRSMRYTNPRVIEAQAEGREFKVVKDFPNKQVVLTRTK